MCFWYNPELAMEYLLANDLIALVQDLTNCLTLFTSDFERERALFALVGLCKMKPDLWPKVRIFLFEFNLMLGASNKYRWSGDD